MLIRFLLRICTKICLNVQGVPGLSDLTVVFVLGGIDFALAGLLWFGIKKVLNNKENESQMKYITSLYEQLFRDALYFWGFGFT